MVISTRIKSIFHREHGLNEKHTFFEYYTTLRMNFATANIWLNKIYLREYTIHMHASSFKGKVNL